MATIGEFAVHLHDDNGTLVSLLPGDEVPGWAARRIGDHALASGDSTDDDGDDEEGGHDGPPPRHGRGSGEDKWRAYAEQNSVDVSNAEGRDDVIAALELAGVPVE
jgi:hypothetical protein